MYHSKRRVILSGIREQPATFSSKIIFIDEVHLKLVNMLIKISYKGSEIIHDKF